MRTLTVLDSFHAAFTEPWKRRIDEQSWLALLWSVCLSFSTFNLSLSLSLSPSLSPYRLLCSPSSFVIYTLGIKSMHANSNVAVYLPEWKRGETRRCLRLWREEKTKTTRLRWYNGSWAQPSTLFRTTPRKDVVSREDRLGGWTGRRDKRRWRHGARVPADYRRRHDAIVGRVTGCRWR